MIVKVYSEPSLEPVTLAELKVALNIDSGTFDGNLTLTQCLAYGSKAITTAYTHLGTGVDVLGKQAEVLLHCGTNAATGTNDTKIQECDTLAGTYTDWATGAFDQVTTTNDNADFKKVYTGSKRYIRTASKVLLAACEFGTSILTNAPQVSDDDLLTDLIEAARRDVENDTSRKLVTQTIDYFPKDWPSGDRIKIPYGNLQSVSFIKWRDTDGVETNLTKAITAFAASSVTPLTKTQVTSAAHGFADDDIINIDGTTSYDGAWVVSNVTTNTFDITIVFVADDATGTATEDYVVETNGAQCGFVVLPYSGTWPTGTLHPSNPITIRYICGYGATASSVPVTARQAIKARCVNLYANRGDDVIGVNTVNYDKTYDRLVGSVGRLFDMDFL